jgi:hypothetical protein
MTLEVDPTQTSRVELEHLALSLILEGGQEADVEAIRAELATRVWQWHNPYSGAAGGLSSGLPGGT